MALPNGSGGYQLGDGNLNEATFRVIPAPATATATATLTAAQVLSNILLGSPGTSAASYTLPTASATVLGGVKLDNVTIHTFPMAFLAADSESKANKALCAPDRARAWNDLMLSNRVPANPGTCETSLGKVAELARKLGITGTPVVFFSSGKRLQGYAPPDTFERMLADSSRP